MKERSAAEVTAAMVAISIEPVTAARIGAGARLQDEAAKKFAADNRNLIALTSEQETLLLRNTVPRYEKFVQKGVAVDLMPYEFDALVSFAYNPGGRLEKVLRLINDGRVVDAMNEIKKAVTSKGKIMKGLVHRRDHEVALYLTGTY